MWEDGLSWCIKVTTGHSHRGEPKWRLAHKNGPEEDSEKDGNEAIVAVPWRKNEDDAKMDGKRLKGEVVMMD